MQSVSEEEVSRLESSSSHKSVNTKDGATQVLQHNSRAVSSSSSRVGGGTERKASLGDVSVSHDADGAGSYDYIESDAKQDSYQQEQTIQELARRITRHDNNQVKVLVVPFDGNEQHYRDMTLRELLAFIQDNLLPPVDVNNADSGRETVDAKLPASRNSESSSLRLSKRHGSGSFSRSLASASNLQRLGSAFTDQSFAGELRYRDLRSLDDEFNPHQEPSVVVRRHIVLLSLEPIRAVISSTHLVLIVPSGADGFLEILDKHLDSIFEKEGSTLESSEGQWRGAGVEESVPNADLSDVNILMSSPHPAHASWEKEREEKENKERPGEWSDYRHMPYEMRAYEAIISTVVDSEMCRYRQLKNKANAIISEFSGISMIPVKHQEAMRLLKNDVSSSISKMESYRRWMEDLFDDDEKMSLMSLSILRDKPDLYAFPLSNEILKTHEEIEMVLDSHYRDFSTLVSKFSLLRQKLTGAQEMVSMKLDTTRNELLKTNMILSIIALYLTLGGFVAGVFGMNLDNTIHLQNAPHVFLSVTIITTGCIVIGIILTVMFFKAYEIIPK